MAQTVKLKNRKPLRAEDTKDLYQEAQERPEVTEALLADITQRIVETCHPEKVILFGSYAYGTPHENSDIDLFVIMDPSDAAVLRFMAIETKFDEPVGNYFTNLLSSRTSSKTVVEGFLSEGLMFCE